jgi:hypothetical protein
VRIPSHLFRGKLRAFLKQSYRRNQLCFPGKLAELFRHAHRCSMPSVETERMWCYNGHTTGSRESRRYRDIEDESECRPLRASRYEE